MELHSSVDINHSGYHSVHLRAMFDWDAYELPKLTVEQHHKTATKRGHKETNTTSDAFSDSEDDIQ